MKIKHLDPEHPEENEILVEGLEREAVLLHLTDAHVAEADERDPQAREAAEHYQGVFQERTPGGAPARQVFSELLERARRLNPDCAALTGDIIHFPSALGLEAIAQGVDGLNYLYTLGNHDWFFPHLQWNEATRQEFYPRFNRLTGGNPACQVKEISGLRLVALDNSTYQVSAAQVDFLREQLQTGQPCVLLVHIPLYIPSLVPAVMERWKAPIMMGAEEGWTEETRAKWLVQGVAESTRACLGLVQKAENLVGILCGHVHFSHADAMREGCCQYVTRPGFEGGIRIIRFKPY